MPEVSLTPSERHAEAALELCRQAEQTTAVVQTSKGMVEVVG